MHSYDRAKSCVIKFGKNHERIFKSLYQNVQSQMEAESMISLEQLVRYCGYYLVGEIRKKTEQAKIEKGLSVIFDTYQRTYHKIRFEVIVDHLPKKTLTVSRARPHS